MTDLPVPDQPVRASDQERELVVARLTEACGEGRLTLEELSGRVENAYAAVHRTDLVPLVSDLPLPTGAGQAVPVVVEPAAKPKRKWVVGIMGSVTRSGHWRMPSHVGVFTLMAETELDLRQAMIESPEIEIDLWLMMGESRVLIPEGVDVEVTGGVIMGERKVKVSPVRPRPGVPRLHIKVRGMMGEVVIKTA